ncbi:hypothetical protein HK104_010307 [Borealophlyctis nickersoniae]|nr:hypothetical protein HK104_010307 [Borealophlyctis nickersoniae]
MVATQKRTHPAHLDGKGKTRVIVGIQVKILRNRTAFRTMHLYSSGAKSSDILRTKIICTIGPASCSKETIGKLVEAGMNVARLNLTHCTHDFAAKVIRDLRLYLDETKSIAEVAIWIDINGPKVRSGRLASKYVTLEAGDYFEFVNDENLIGDNKRVATTYTKQLLRVGDQIYIDDGLLSFTVVERLENSIKCKVNNSGELGENKGINFPRHVIEDLPAVSEKDKADIAFAVAQGVDFISVSCIRSVQDVQAVRHYLGSSNVKLLAKIENQRGVDNYESIVQLADGIVIDRGYLGAEIDVDLVTVAQKKMIVKANVAGKPIIVANQILESMKTNPRPARSEAAGSYVLECVQQMRRIAYQAEKNTDYNDYSIKMMRNVPRPISVSESIASSAVQCARQVDAAIIICVTERGGTARLVAKYRPQIPVVAVTMVPSTARQLNVNFGMVSYHYKGQEDSVINESLRYAVELGLCKPGQIAVITSGQVIGFTEGTTTKMQLAQVPSF